MRTKTTVAENTQSGVFALIAGESGVGKTYLASTLPHDDTIIVSKESGLRSLRKIAPSIEVESIDDFNDLAAITEEIKLGKYTKKTNIYIDSLTDILDTELADLKVKFAKKDSFNMWDEYLLKARWVITTLRDITNKNIFFTCLSNQEKDGLAMVDQFDFTGKNLKAKIKSFFDLCFHLQAMNDGGESYRALVTDTAISPLAKDRSGLLLPIEKPDLTYIINKLS